MVDYSEPLPAVNAQRLRVAQGLVLLFHITGFVGLAFSDNPGFYLRFTPLTLLLTAGLLLAFQPDRGLGFWSFCFSVALLGFAAEVIGVHTGWFFGHYYYGDTLGYKVLEVPVAIGLNWLVLTYVCGTLARYMPLPELPRILVAALLMVGLDMCMEPVASTYDFWHWTANVIPFQNFRDWFIFACLLQMLFNRANFTKLNALVPLVYLTQLLFFFLLGALR
ncbi:carotenoid biosynthesis protein [Hymenobacter sp. BT683]|uniref:Carotenoid biosynthesis protein n=1 Tax=Hymenobacter jeongseonensis TaxID=2791027 RepID=A0ABS0IBR1_9BACT|nr:carotenoid biosynthesis protein [Hymenobacter jeongseonensis]MBF9235791.1 carotenoid biosynthesis protein [Hymenobacter jeongseonensis]